MRCDAMRCGDAAAACVAVRCDALTRSTPHPNVNKQMSVVSRLECDCTRRISCGEEEEDTAKRRGKKYKHEIHANSGVRIHARGARRMFLLTNKW